MTPRPELYTLQTSLSIIISVSTSATDSRICPYHILHYMGALLYLILGICHVEGVTITTEMS